MCAVLFGWVRVFFFKQNTAYEMRISDWSSDVCSSDLGAEAEFGGKRVHLFRPMVLGDRAAPLATLARRIAEARKALTLRPAVHVVEEFAALLGGRGRGDRANDVARGDDIGEAAEARAGEVQRDVGDDQRVAQIGERKST